MCVIQPTNKCVDYVKKTNAELWVDEGGLYYVVYPNVRVAHEHSVAVLDFSEMYDTGAFEVFCICKAVVNSLSGARRVM